MIPTVIASGLPESLFFPLKEYVNRMGMELVTECENTATPHAFARLSLGCAGSACSLPLYVLSPQPVTLAELGYWLANQHQRFLDNRVFQLTENVTFYPLLRCMEQKEPKLSVTLTDKESELLYHLVITGKAGLSRDELLQKIWGMDAEKIETRTVETHIYRLRAKLESLARGAIQLQHPLPAANGDPCYRLQFG